MENEPTAAGGQQRRLTLVEAGRALSAWLKEKWPGVKTHAGFVRLLINKGVLPEYRGKEITLQMSISNLRKGHWVKNKHCPREVALKVLRWMGMEESKIPQAYLDSPIYRPRKRLPKKSIPRTRKGQLQFSRTVNMSASEALALHLREAGRDYAAALRECQPMLIEIGVRRGGLRDLTPEMIERDIQTADFFSQSGADPSNPIDLGLPSQAPVVETPSCGVLVSQFQRTARAYVIALRECKPWLINIAKRMGKSGDHMGEAIEQQIRRVSAYWYYLTEHQKSESQPVIRQPAGEK